MIDTNEKTIIIKAKQKAANIDWSEMEKEVASTEEVKIISECLIKQNMEAYRKLAR